MDHSSNSKSNGERYRSRYHGPPAQDSFANMEHIPPRHRHRVIQNQKHSHVAGSSTHVVNPHSMSYPKNRSINHHRTNVNGAMNNSPVCNYSIPHHSNRPNSSHSSGHDSGVKADRPGKDFASRQSNADHHAHNRNHGAHRNSVRIIDIMYCMFVAMLVIEQNSSRM